MAEVLQCDRDAANTFRSAAIARLMNGEPGGWKDTPDDYLVQAFAAHREAAEKAERQAVVDWLLSDGARLDYEASGSEEHFSWWAADVVLQGIRDALEAIEARKAPK